MSLGRREKKGFVFLVHGEICQAAQPEMPAWGV